MKILMPLAAAGLLVGGWYGGPLVHPTKPPTPAPRQTGRPISTDIGPKAFSAAQLRAEAMALGQPIFWAGPARGVRYEFTRTRSDHVYVRYLPLSVYTGAPGARFLIVATYRFPQAYKALKRIARGKGIVGPGGSFMYARPNDPRSVLLAFPRMPYEIEVYDPRPALAASIAQSGLVRPVG